jgi:hypothetical protein
MSAPSLKDIQNTFQALLLTPSHNTPDWIMSDELSAKDRLAIYSEGYRLRLCEALVGDFPAIAFLMGEDTFNQYCLNYIDAHPSTHFSLRYFGKHFAHFLETHGETLYAQLATFEWALTDAFDAQDETSLTKNDLARLPIEAWEALTFTLHSSVEFLTLHSNAPLVWQAFKNENLTTTLVNQNEPTTWLVWRQELKLFFRPLTRIEDHALQVIKTKGTWQQVCDQIATLDEVNAASLAANFLNTWITDGILSD